MSGIKYIAPIGNSGYAEAAKDYMIALHNAGHEITLECFRFDNTTMEPAEERDLLVSSFIDRDIEYDTVIIHSTPEHWPKKIKPYKDKKVIGMTVWETTKLHPDWTLYLNAVDEVVVPCEWNRKVFTESGVVRPITVIPHILRPSDAGHIKLPGIEHRYVFYTIGQWHNRKGIDDTIRAYLKAFTSKDNVVLVVKTFSNDFSVGQQNLTLTRIQEIVTEFPDPALIVPITKELTRREIDGVHTIGDCYVSLCKSEGWGLGAFDAAGKGNPVIMTGFGGQVDFLSRPYDKLVNYRLIHCGGMPWIKWYRSNQKWAKPDVLHAAHLMRNQVINRQSNHSSENRSKEFKETFGEGTVIRKLEPLIGRPSITEFTILGERCSGTSFLEAAISTNFNIKRTWRFGWKHWMGNRDYSESSSTLFIAIVRDPHAWVNSLYRTPHHLPLHSKTSKHVFLNEETYAIDENGNEIMADRNMMNGKRYRNIIECRSVKLRYFLEQLPLLVDNYVLIRYEDLKDNYEQTLQNLKARFQLDAKFSDFKTIHHYKGDRLKRYKETIPTDFPRNSILEHPEIDIQMERKMGYLDKSSNNLPITNPSRKFMLTHSNGFMQKS